MKPFDEQLIRLSRYWFERSREVLEQADIFSCNLAICMMQDSIEFILNAIAKVHSVQFKGEIGFDKLWSNISDKLSQTSSTSLALPYQIEMRNLNRSRNQIKHGGVLISVEEGKRYFEQTHSFLSEAVKTFFGVEFDTFSLADTIERDEVREKILLAEEDYRNERYFDCVQNCGKAFHIILEVIPQAYDEGGLDLERIGQFVNLNRRKYERFNALLPQISRAESGKFWVKITRILENQYAEEDAIYCLEFVTEFALTFQNQVPKDWYVLPRWRK